MILLRVLGIPAPQGSKRALVHRSTGRAVLIESSKRLPAWRAAVKACALAAVARPPEFLDGPLDVSIDFALPRPKGRKAATLPDRRPDIDKLVRAVLDACTGVVWRDDSQVVTLSARKQYGQPGAVIMVSRATT